MRVLGEPAAHPPALHERDGGDAGQECDDRGRGDSGGGDDGEAGTRRPVGRAGRGDRRHRCERRVVEQPEDDQAQAERPDARLRARIALHDRDADRVVDAARKGDPADTCGPARKGEGVGSRPFARVEEPLPAPGLEGVRDEEEEGCAGDEQRVGVVNRPAGADEVANADERHAQQHEPEAAVQDELNLPIGEKPHHRSCNAAIG